MLDTAQPSEIRLNKIINKGKPPSGKVQMVSMTQLLIIYRTTTSFIHIENYLKVQLRHSEGEAWRRDEALEG